MTDLTKKPFNLSSEDIAWVKETISGMTIEEKIGQLFINLGRSTEESYIRMLVEKFHIGGARYTETSRDKVYAQNKMYQKFSRIPMFVATNCETGGNGACKEGTFVATEAQCGATSSLNAAYEMGRISGIEATAIGCNWTFSPIADIIFNWRNTIVNTRSFGNDPRQVLEMSQSYIDGAHESNILTCAKHFPGDGVEERDQHLVLGINDLTYEEWKESFGMVYKELIDSGLESVMVGHIAFPDYSKRFGNVEKMEDILPATIAPELINGLLRNELGFNGLVVTDASHMGGLFSAKPRCEIVPEAIAAGCDIFLFLHDIEEDFGYMMDGYKNGVITEERLQNALEHIIGMKAKLGLHKYDFINQTEKEQEKLKLVGCEEHQKIAEKVADESITLVKDINKLLPINVNERKRAKLVFLESYPTSFTKGGDPAKGIVVEELEKAGFLVDVSESYYEMEIKNSSPMNKYKIMETPKVEDFKNTYDIVFMFVNMRGYAQENNVRLKFSASHSNEIPWWIREVPTVCVSLNYTTHLYDLPMMKTFINAYSDTRTCIRATIEKIIGKSEFKGKYNDTVWCNSWDTKI